MGEWVIYLECENFTCSKYITQILVTFITTIMSLSSKDKLIKFLEISIREFPHG